MQNFRDIKNFSLSARILTYSGSQLDSVRDIHWGDESGSDLAFSESETHDGAQISAKFVSRTPTPPIALGIAFQFEDWRPDNEIFIPGAVYRGNRFQAVGQSYPPFYPNHRHPIGIFKI